MNIDAKIRLSVSRLIKGKLSKIDENVDPPDVIKEKRVKWAAFTKSFINVEMTVDELTEHIRSGWSISAELTEPYRKKENFKSCQILGLDFDTGDQRSSVESLMVEPFIREHALLVHTTSSHTEEHPRARVLFLTTMPVMDPGKYVELVKKLLKRFKQEADSQCNDPARLWYGAPGCRLEVIGKILDPTDLGESGDWWQREGDKWTPFGEPIPEGTRNNHCYHYALQFALDGKTKDEILRLLFENWEKLGYHVPKAEMESAVDNAVKKAIDMMRAGVAGPHDTQLGNAERFVKQHIDVARYVPQWSRWIVWNGIYWEPDIADKSHQLAIETVKSIYREASELKDDSDRKRRAAHAFKSESFAMIKGMTALAATFPEIVIFPDRLDADKDLLNVLNGTLNLRTGCLEPHKREDFITRVVNIEYDEWASCHRTAEWLKWAMGGDEDMVTYLWRSLGRSLFGGNPEKEAFFAYGGTNTGKTTFTKLLERLAGPYAARFNVELLLKQKMSRNANDATPELAKLHGARVAIGTEMPANRKLNEAAFKDFTGKDTLTARNLHMDPFDFEPQFTPWMYGNDRPDIRSEDEATFSRLRMLPFKAVLPTSGADPDLVEHVFIPELPGILRMAFNAAVEVRHQLMDKVPVPSASQAEKEDYKREVDHVQQFIETGVMKSSAGGKVKTTDVYNVFVGYEKSEHGIKYTQVTSNIFSKRLVKILGCQTARSNGSTNIVGYELDSNVSVQWVIDSQWN